MKRKVLYEEQIFYNHPRFERITLGNIIDKKIIASEPEMNISNKHANKQDQLKSFIHKQSNTNGFFCLTQSEKNSTEISSDKPKLKVPNQNE